MQDDKLNRLIWIDLEMTGLRDEDVIVEIATLVIDAFLNILAEGPEIAIFRTEEELAGIDPWAKEQHSSSGLLTRVQGSKISLREAEKQTLTFLSDWADPGTLPLCGNSVSTDRRFIRKEMPGLDQFLHYRIVDVSTVKELVHRWYPEMIAPEKQSSHTALADIRESIEELLWYRNNVFLPSKPDA